jgi:abortive infection bacteriophage resistance protein
MTRIFFFVFFLYSFIADNEVNKKRFSPKQEIPQVKGESRNISMQIYKLSTNYKNWIWLKKESARNSLP